MGDPMSIRVAQQAPRSAPRAVSVSNTWIRWVSNCARQTRCTKTRVLPRGDAAEQPGERGAVYTDA